MATLLQKAGLLRGLCNGERACTGPFYITVDLTRRCNLRCFGCRFHSEEIGAPSPGDQQIAEFPFEWAENLFSDVATLGTRQLFLLGDGEPFLHPRLFDIIRLAKQHQLRATINTNGTFLDEARVQQVIDSGLDEIHVSLWACSAESYARQHGVDASFFHRVLNGLKLLSAMKAEQRVRTPHVTLHHPINCFNYNDVDKMVILAKETGCDAISFSPFKTARGQLAHYALPAEEQTALRNRMTALQRQIEALNLGHNLRRFLARMAFHEISHGLPCYVCWFHSRIKVDGTVVSCGRSMLALGSLKTDRFPDIWNGEAYRAERIRRLAPDGQQYREEIADCQVCGYVEDNQKIHRIFKHLQPFVRRFNKSSQP